MVDASELHRIDLLLRLVRRRSYRSSCFSADESEEAQSPRPSPGMHTWTRTGQLPAERRAPRWEPSMRFLLRRFERRSAQSCTVRFDVED